MAYTAVKLDDVKKAIAAVTAANKKYTDAQASSKTTKTTLDSDKKKLDDALAKLKTLQTDFDNQKYLTTDAGYKTAKTAVETAQKKLDDARAYLNSGTYLTKDTGYQNALKNLKNAEAARDKAYKAMFDPDPKKARAGEVAYGKETTNIQKAEAALDVARSNAEKTAQKPITDAEKQLEIKNTTLEKAKTTAAATAQKPIDAQQKVVNTNQTTYDTTNEKYQGIINSFDTLINERNNAVNGVTEYLTTFQNSLGSVTKKADATAAKTLLTNIGKAVTDAKIPDLQKAYDTTTKGWDVMKMAAIPTVNIKDANPDVFGNIDPNSKLPILDQASLDAVLDKYKGNQIDTQQYRDNWNKFGWNVKSDASTALRGPAVVGLDKGIVGGGTSGMGGFTAAQSGYIKVGGGEATDADFKKSADLLKIDYNSYVKPVKFEPTVGGYGVTERATAQNSKEYTDPATGETYLARASGGKYVTRLDKEALYNDISERTKDFYLVANSIDGDKHASILFKADGSGNLVPVVDTKGNPQVNYYTATRNVKGGAWYEDLLPVAAIAAAVFAPQAIGQIAAAMGGTTAATIAAGAIYNASTAALLGGDPLQAGVMGAAGAAASLKATEIANAAVGGAENVAKIAEIANVTVSQAEKAIAAGVTTGLTSAALDRDNIIVNSAAAVAGQLGSAQAKNAVQDAMLDSPSMNTAANVASNIAEVTAQTVVRMGAGQDVDLASALQNSMPAIIGDAVATAGRTGTTPIVEKGITPEPFDMNAEINKAFSSPSVKLEVAQALPATAEQLQTLTKMGEQNLAQRFSSMAANDPKFVRELANPENIQALRNAGMNTLAEALSKFSVAVTGLITPGNIGQVTNEDLIMAEKLKQFIDPVTLPPVNVIGDTSDIKFPGSDIPASEIEKAQAIPSTPMPDGSPVVVPKPPLPIAIPTTTPGTSSSVTQPDIPTPTIPAPDAAPAPSPAPASAPDVAPAPAPAPDVAPAPAPAPAPDITPVVPSPDTTTAPSSPTTSTTDTYNAFLGNKSGSTTTSTPDKTLPPVEVIGEPEEDTTEGSQGFPLTDAEKTTSESTTGEPSPRQQMLDLYASLTSQPTAQKPTAKWFDRFLGSTMPTPGYKSIFDPTEYEFLDTELPDQVEFMEPLTPPPSPDQTTPQSPLSQAATLSTNPQAYTMQGASTVPSSYYQYGDLSALNLGSNFLTPATGTPYARGGLASMRPTAALFAARGGEVPHKGSHYVQGAGGGQDDLIDARLADGEYVFDADVVAALGDGSNAEGARRLDKMREAIRKHKRSAPNDKIPPKAKSPLAYFKGAK